MTGRFGRLPVREMSDAGGLLVRGPLEFSARDDDWNTLAGSLDAAVDTFCYLRDLQATASLAGALDNAFASLRWPYISSTGPGLAVRTANLEHTRQTLGHEPYEHAWAKGAAMSWQGALAFALDRL